MPHRPALLNILFSEPNTYPMIYFHVFNFLHYTAPIFKASEYQMRKSYFKQHISHVAEKLPILAALGQTDKDCCELYDEVGYKKQSRLCNQSVFSELHTLVQRVFAFILAL